MHADTRQRLLDIAEQLFAERGFYGVSIAAIASEVGVSKRHYFNRGSADKGATSLYDAPRMPQTILCGTGRTNRDKYAPYTFTYARAA